MYSSVKFLVPSLIVGCAAGAETAPAANPPNTMATPNEMQKAAFTARRVCLRITSPSLPGPRVDPDRGNVPLAGLVAESGAGGHVGLVGGPAADAARAQHPLHAADREVREERQRGDAVRGAEDTLEPVARLVDDDVAETAAARDGGDRRRGNDVDGGRADAREDQRQ